MTELFQRDFLADICTIRCYKNQLFACAVNYIPAGTMRVPAGTTTPTRPCAPLAHVAYDYNATPESKRGEYMEDSPQKLQGKKRGGRGQGRGVTFAMHEEVFHSVLPASLSPLRINVPSVLTRAIGMPSVLTQSVFLEDLVEPAAVDAYVKQQQEQLALDFLAEEELARRCTLLDTLAKVEAPLLLAAQNTFLCVQPIVQKDEASVSLPKDFRFTENCSTQ